MSPAALEVIPGGRSSDREHLKELYRRYGGAVFGRCLYLLKERTAAEDAMQDVFARALAHWSDFRTDASPITWLFKIATHHCLNLQRAERAPWRNRFEADERARGEAHGGPQVLETRDAIHKALARFDLETQRAVVHYHLDEMTLEEVAALLDRSVPTVRKRLREFAEATGQELVP